MKTKYIWQHRDWPNFKYDNQIISELTSIFLEHYRALINDSVSLPLEGRWLGYSKRGRPIT